MTSPLYDILPPAEDVERSSDELLGRFLDYVAGKGLELYRAQEEAILGLFEGKNLILNTPTGSGKTLVASALHFAALARGRRSVYTSALLHAGCLETSRSRYTTRRSAASSSTVTTRCQSSRLM